MELYRSTSTLAVSESEVNRCGRFKEREKKKKVKTLCKSFMATMSRVSSHLKHGGL